MYQTRYFSSSRERERERKKRETREREKKKKREGEKRERRERREREKRERERERERDLLLSSSLQVLNDIFKSQDISHIILSIFPWSTIFHDVHSLSGYVEINRSRGERLTERDRAPSPTESG